jgi:hypothetical protein
MSGRETDPINQPTESELTSGISALLPNARFHKMVGNGSKVEIIADNEPVPEGYEVYNTYTEGQPIGTPVGYTNRVNGVGPGLLDQIHVHNTKCVGGTYCDGIPIRLEYHRGGGKDSGICH